MAGSWLARTVVLQAGSCGGGCQSRLQGGVHVVEVHQELGVAGAGHAPALKGRELLRALGPGGLQGALCLRVHLARVRWLCVVGGPPGREAGQENGRCK